MIGNGWCDDAEDPETNTQGCGYDGGDCQCLRDYNNIKTDCSFPTVVTPFVVNVLPEAQVP